LCRACANYFLMAVTLPLAWCATVVYRRTRNLYVWASRTPSSDLMLFLVVRTRSATTYESVPDIYNSTTYTCVVPVRSLAKATFGSSVDQEG